jgi:cadmium resistance protein CadD (predicted permease)
MPLAIFWATLVEGILAFVATHIDDFFLLVLLFAQAQLQPLWKGWHIWLGRLLGLGRVDPAQLSGIPGGPAVAATCDWAAGVDPDCGRAVGNCGNLSWKKPWKKSWKNCKSAQPKRLGQFFLPPPALMSMLLTFANGGDNVSLYVPLFAGSTPLQLALFATIFFLMKGLWFAMAQKLTMQPAVAKVLTERTEHWVPWILVGLGVWILFKNETWRWLLS